MGALITTNIFFRGPKKAIHSMVDFLNEWGHTDIKPTIAKANAHTFTAEFHKDGPYGEEYETIEDCSDSVKDFMRHIKRRVGNGRFDIVIDNESTVDGAHHYIIISSWPEDAVVWYGIAWDYSDELWDSVRKFLTRCIPYDELATFLEESGYEIDIDEEEYPDCLPDELPEDEEPPEENIGLCILDAISKDYEILIKYFRTGFGVNYLIENYKDAVQPI